MTTATPLYFGQAGELFGWYHPATGPVTRGCNVILCRPLGHEYICSHRGFRILAERLAANGFSVLNFDYFGTGDSAGDVEDPHLLRRWTDSVAAAADEIQRRSPGNPLAFVGLRFGASIAALTALERNDVDALVLWEPCVSGKSYMRQLKMLAATTGHDEPAAEQRAASLGIEAAGFLFSEPTVETITGVQLTKLTPAATKRALILTRDDVPPDPKLATHFRTIGVDTEERPFSGYVDFMTATFRSVVPEATIDGIVQWLADAHLGTANAAQNTTPSIASNVGAKDIDVVTTRTETHEQSATLIHERLVWFGDKLFGILTTPDKYDPATPAVIFLNTGADHHVGPHRLYVPLARDWAAQGIPVLRFDQSGLGDSPTRPGAESNKSYSSHALSDVDAAVTFMRDQGYHRVILSGICSGAFHSIHAAHAGSAVVGTIAVNPALYVKEGDSLEVESYWTEAPHWVESEVERVTQAMFASEKWLRFFTGKIDYKYTFSLFWDKIRISANRTLANVGRLFTSAKNADSKDDIAALFPPHVHNHIIFSRDDPGYTYVLRSVGEKKLQALQKRGSISLQLVEGADHTFMASHLQNRLTELLTEALRTRFKTPITPAL